MKKTFTAILVLLQILTCTFSFIGCSDNNNFKLVKSIKIVTNGTEKKFSSSTKPDVIFKENYHYISQDEFARAPTNRKYYNDEFNSSSFSKISIDDAIKSAKNSTIYEIVESELQGFYYWCYWFETGGNIYYTKREYEVTRFQFVYVCIKNDTTVIIKHGSNETTYTVTSYTVNYF